MAGKKILSSEMTASILDAFTDYVSGHGQVKYRAMEAGMKAFMALPANTQKMLMREDFSQDKVRALLVGDLLDDETVKELSLLSPEDRLDVMKKAAKISKKVSRKKQAL